MPTRSLKRKSAQNWYSISWLVDYAQNGIIISCGENYDIAFANNHVINVKKVPMLTWQNCTRKRERPYKALDPALHQREHCKRQIYVPAAANVASSQNFAFNGPLLKIWHRCFQTWKTMLLLNQSWKPSKKKIQTLFHLMNKSYGGPSDDFWLRSCWDGLPFVVDWKAHY